MNIRLTIDVISIYRMGERREGVTKILSIITTAQSTLIAAYIFRTNHKHAKNPIDPVSMKNVSEIILI